MESGPSRFGLSLRRSKNDGDDWYIPYKPPAIPTSFQGGIGHSPAPVRSPSTKVFSFFSTSSSVPQNDFDPAYSFQDTPHHANRRPYRSPSFSSLADRPANPFAIPSSASVPTGLAGPKMLFSPLQREMRSPPYPPPSPIDHSPRRRIQSNPKPASAGPQRWAAQSMCDMLVFPKPHITPHTITPPSSPPHQYRDSPDVLEMGQLRLREREEWAQAAQPQRVRSNTRGRSLSVGRQDGPPPGAPIIGSANARREEAEDRERRRSSSASRATFGRLRSSSFGIGSARTSNSISGGRQSSEQPSLFRRTSSDRFSRKSAHTLPSCMSHKKSKSVVDLGLDERESAVAGIGAELTDR